MWMDHRAAAEAEFINNLGHPGKKVSLIMLRILTYFVADMGEINRGGLPDLDQKSRLGFFFIPMHRDYRDWGPRISPISISIFQKVEEASPISISTQLDLIFVEISRYLAHS